MSAIFNFLKMRYDLGKHDNESLKIFVKAKKLTPDEYKEITGAEYKEA